VFFFYDGISFFGFSDYKLARIRGKSPGWCDKCQSIRLIVVYLLFIAIILYVLINEGTKIGTEKKMEIDLESDNEYKYNITEGHFPLIGVMFLQLDEVS
jgi:hypothetical protein